ncbi:MAG: glycosyltransferase family 2 protein [Candidatus Kaelpia imicola]|nr:glycosyltransferase family 2 protein [Candidatus Kaelpia imicola]
MEKIIRHSISVVLPFYNEQYHIERAITDINDYLVQKFQSYEIILVDDGSKDSSFSIAHRLSLHNDRIKLIKHNSNTGYGASLATGFKNCSNDTIFFTDSDRQFDIKNLELLLPSIRNHDIVIGYRKIRKDSLLRIVLSKGYNLLMRYIFNLNVKDIDCAFKLFHKDIFNKITIESKRFSVNTEILAKAKIFNLSIAEISVEHFPRLGDYSKIGIQDIPRTLREVFRIWKSTRRIKKDAELF